MTRDHIDLEQCEPSTSGSSGSESMDASMNTFDKGGFARQTRFVLVNDRVPRTGRKCELCGNIVEKGYVRDARTRLIYCDAECLARKWI
jgi:hypothetical protein